MAGEWMRRKIGSLGRVITGKTPPTSDPRNFGHEYPFITIPDLDGRRDITSTARMLSQQGADTITGSRLPAGAVMMSCIATIGRCGITTQPSFTNQQINSVICNEETDPKFVYYAFTQLRPALEATGSGGSVYTNVSRARFSDLEIPLPPLSEQRAIAGILGALDDKIALNRRLSRTLEAMAQALFQSWFVDFDPVRAKAEGRAPEGLSPQVAALFPSAFQDSELGEIPEGWEVKALGDLAQIRGGTQLSSDGRRPKGAYPVFGANGIMGYAARATHDSFVIVFGRVGTCGSVHWAYDGAWVNNNATSVVPYSCPEYLLQAMLNIDFHAMRAGSAQPFIPNTALSAAKVLWPAESVAEAFCASAHAIRTRQALLLENARVLGEARDILVPRLVSGELRVAAARDRM